MLKAVLSIFGPAFSTDHIPRSTGQRKTPVNASLAAAIRSIGMASLLAGTTMAQAATVTVHSVIDLSAWNIANGIGALGTTPDTVSFEQGDTVILDIDFLGNQTLKFASVSSIGGAVLSTAPDCPHSTASLFLHDFSGNGQATITGGQYQGCAAQLGATFSSAAPGSSSGAIEFSGVTFTFANVVLSGNELRFASGGRLDMVAKQGSVGHLDGATGVPEPSGWALASMGLGALGVALRRRRKL